MALVNFKEMLEDARNNKYAIGMFDVSDLEMIRAVTGEAENLHSPVILGALAPDLEDGRLDYWFAAAELAAKKSSIPVCIHLDHANTLQQVIQAVNTGFSSVMLDASASDFEENIRRSREVAEAVRKHGISVEAELGHVGNGWVGSGESSESGPDMLTEPDKVAEFIEKTGVDALAVSIGTAHGVYMKTPALDIERLKNINAASRWFRMAVPVLRKISYPKPLPTVYARSIFILNCSQPGTVPCWKSCTPSPTWQRGRQYCVKNRMPPCAKSSGRKSVFSAVQISVDFSAHTKLPESASLMKPIQVICMRNLAYKQTAVACGKTAAACHWLKNVCNIPGDRIPNCLE